MSTVDQPVLTPDDERALATEFARLVVASAAPDDRDVFEETAADYFDDPEAMLRPAAVSDQRGGFGGLPEAPALALCALPVVVPVIRYLAGVVVEAVQADVRPRLVALVRRLFHPETRRDAAAVVLSADQIALVRQMVYVNALSLTKNEGDATLLANAVKGCLDPPA